MGILQIPIKTLKKHFLFLLIGSLSIGLLACGGGGGGSSGVAIPGMSQNNAGDGIGLLSVTFPKSVDQIEFYPSPPESAPLGQQIVFTFSGLVAGNVTSSSVLIYADAGQAYSGPLVLLEPTKNVILAKGTFDIHGNVVVFTPDLPKKEMNLKVLVKIRYM